MGMVYFDYFCFVGAAVSDYFYKYKVWDDEEIKREEGA